MIWRVFSCPTNKTKELSRNHNLAWEFHIIMTTIAGFQNGTQRLQCFFLNKNVYSKEKNKSWYTK